jgi:hypothetical protein
MIVSIFSINNLYHYKNIIEWDYPKIMPSFIERFFERRKISVWAENWTVDKNIMCWKWNICDEILPFAFITKNFWLAFLHHFNLKMGNTFWQRHRNYAKCCRRHWKHPLQVHIFRKAYRNQNKSISLSVKRNMCCL